MRLASAVAVALLSLTMGPLAGSARAFQSNTPPTITPASRKALKIQKGGLPKNFVVAQVSDAETPANDLVVTLVSSAPGLNVTNIVNTNGTVTADLAADCNAPGGRKKFRLQVSDGSLTSQSDISVVIQNNTVPVIGAYGTTTIQVNDSTTITPSAPPTDNGTVTNLTVAITSPAGFTGSVSIDQVTGVITVTNAAPANTYTGTVTATDNCGAMSTRTFTLIVNATPNQPPVANAGPPQTVDCCTIVTLDGTGSFDPDNMPSPLTYAWVQAGGSPVVLSGASTATPSFQSLNVAGSGQLMFQLTVSDGALANSAFVTITVNQVPGLHVQTEGLFTNGGNTFILHNCNFYGPADNLFFFGPSGEVPVTGDFDGDAVDTVGAYIPSSGCFFLTNTNASGGADLVFCFGPPNVVPLFGDWDGDGVDTVGVYDSATGNFFLKNTNAPGGADIVFQFGAGGAGVIPLAGDWNGDGVDTIGIYIQSSGVFFLRNSNTPGLADITCQFGTGGEALPITGNWDGIGGDTIGLYVPSTGAFFLKNTNTPGGADIVFQFGPGGGNFTPLTGNWDGL